MKQDKANGRSQTGKSSREERLAEALRENLRRRKAASGTGPKPKAIKNREQF